MLGACSVAQSPREQAIVDLTNQERSEAGVGPLVWDAALAAAAQAHAERMAREGPISHRYGGEPDLPERAANAGARFSLIEENIAVADTPFHVHQGWMRSQGHHDNLLNPAIDRIGVGIVEARGVLYVAADYSRAVAALTPEQVEAGVAKIFSAKGISLLTDAGSVASARRYCALEDGEPRDAGAAGNGMKARFLMRWQSAQITNLPPELLAALASGRYTQAAVGACPARGDDAEGAMTFSGYRAAVLLY